MEVTTSENKTSSSGRGALLVAAGILLSRLAGLARERIFAHYFGNSDAADVFKAALRIPNFLQNLFGEGVLSASFIPVYAKLRAEKKDDEAREVALAVGFILLIAVTLLVLVGVSATPLLINLVAPGFVGEKREYAIQLVRILFPGTGLLVMSAWCLGILNSHGKFFLSYSAPVIWNIAIIAALYLGGENSKGYELALLTGWGVVIGSFLQMAVQVPSTVTILRSLALHFARARSGVRRVITSFGPVVIGRGVVQISAYIDSMLASLLPTGAVSALAYAQTIYLLPVSLFGMAVSAAELPAMASITGATDELNSKLVQQLNRGLKRISFFVVPSAAAFLGLGDSISSILFQGGRFTVDDNLYIWGILAGSAVGLLAATMGRLYASAFYALHDTKTPLRYAVIRVSLTVLLGIFGALYLPPLLGVDLKWGVAGLTASAGVAGWVEFFLLQRRLNSIIGKTGVSLSKIAQLWLLSIFALCCAWTARHFIPVSQGSLFSCGILALFGIAYLGTAALLGIEEARTLTRRFR